MGPPAEPTQDTPEQRMTMLEQLVYALHSRVARAEETNTHLTSKNQFLTGMLVKSFQVCLGLC